jgi:xanthine dehydrogenase accessory factor
MDTLSFPRDLAVWQYAAESLRAGVAVALLAVVRSEGSSPGRQGFKMSVTEVDTVGSIGGGIMEHKLVELVRTWLREGRHAPEIRQQVHRAQAPAHRSGMICSGEQEILLLPLLLRDLPAVEASVAALQHLGGGWWEVSAAARLRVLPAAPTVSTGEYQPGPDWRYTEPLGFRDQLTIVGGGHVALALSRVMSTLDFGITVLDDRPDLPTQQRNIFAHHRRTVPYEQLRQHIPTGPHQYIVIMTVGYRTDAVALRELLHHPVRYLGVMGSQAKIEHLLQEMRAAGVGETTLARVHAPIGLPIHSRTPEEIAISVAAELIRERNR